MCGCITEVRFIPYFCLDRVLRLGWTLSSSSSPFASSATRFRFELALPSATANSRPARITAALGNWGSLSRSLAYSSPVNPASQIIISCLLQRHSHSLSFRHHDGSSLSPRDPPSKVPQISPLLLHVAHFASFAKVYDMGNQKKTLTLKRWNSSSWTTNVFSNNMTAIHRLHNFKSSKLWNRACPLKKLTSAPKQYTPHDATNGTNVIGTRRTRNISHCQQANRWPISFGFQPPLLRRFHSSQHNRACNELVPRNVVSLWSAQSIKAQKLQ